MQHLLPQSRRSRVRSVHAAQTPRQASPSVCPKCGQRLKPNAVVCVECGHNLKVGLNVKTVARAKKAGLIVVAVSIGAGAALLAGLVWGGIAYYAHAEVGWIVWGGAC